MASPQSADRPVVYLHLGTPKSGTTYLQNILWRHRAALREVGFSYPGKQYSSQFWATLDLVGHLPGGHPNPQVPGAWGRLMETVRSRSAATTVISHELLTIATPEQVARAISDLAFADVHLVLTVRDLARQIPSVWQEDLKNRHSLGFGDYLEGLRDPQGSGVKQAVDFWRMQDAAGIFARWGASVPVERTHIVTVPPPGEDHDLLWRRFAGLVGIAAADHDLSGVELNPSLGAAEAMLLRLLNLRLQGKIDWPEHRRSIKFGLASTELVRAPDKIKIALPAEAHGWVGERAGEIIDRLRTAGYPVTGDLADLLPREPDPASRLVHPDDLGDAELLDAAVDTIGVLALRLADVREQLQSERRKARELRRVAEARESGRGGALLPRLGALRKAAGLRDQARRPGRPRSGA